MLLALLTLLLSLSASQVSAGEWKTLFSGVDYKIIQLLQRPKISDGKLHVLRIDPTKATLVILAASQLDHKNRTAAQWSKKHKLLVTINAGMFNTDHMTHTGYMRIKGKTNSSKWVSNYESILFLDPRQADLPKAQIEDRNQQGHSRCLAAFGTVIQNLRLIRSPGKNVWTRNKRLWSEALIAQDDKGHLLFLFIRTPLSMFDLNRLLLKTDLGITHAMHAEGGPEASLSIHAGSLDLDLCGSYETGFNENDNNHKQWPIPNVIGVLKTQ